MGRRIKKKDRLSFRALFGLFLKINIYNNISGNNNTISNVIPKNIYKSFSFVNEINFTSKKGMAFYTFLVFALYIAWVICIACANPIMFVVALTIIPFLLFGIGKKYLKQKEDKKHLKIHNFLLSIVLISILMLIIISFYTSLMGKQLITIICISIAFNLLASFCLYFNALGGGKIIDFVIGAFIKIS